MIKGISPQDQRDLILSVGVHQQERPLSPIQVAELLQNAINSDTAIKDLSNEVLLDATMIARFRRLVSLAPEIQHLVSWGGQDGITFSTASEIARLETPEEHKFLVKATLEHGLSKKEVIQVVEARKKFRQPFNECVEEILQMRPHVVRRYLFIGAVRSLEVQKKLAEMAQEERNVLFNKAVTSKYPDLPYWEGQLGIKGFTLTGNEELNQAITKLPTDFESSLNDYFESSISKE